MQITIETITPTTAKRILSLQDEDGHRTISDRHVRRLADDFKAGRWQLNGETIKLAGDRVVDGRHRLSACVLANVSFSTAVARDVPADCASTIDTGRPRRLSDVLRMQGLVSANERMIGAALVVLWKHERGIYGRGDNNRTASHSELLAVLDAHPALLNSGPPARRVVAARLCAPGPFMAFHYLFAKKDRVLAETFSDALVTGINLRTYEPVLTLRNAFVRARQVKNTKTEGVVQMAYTVKAWNATRRGEDLRHLRWSDNEEFPRVL